MFPLTLDAILWIFFIVGKIFVFSLYQLFDNWPEQKKNFNLTKKFKKSDLF